MAIDNAREAAKSQSRTGVEAGIEFGVVVVFRTPGLQKKKERARVIGSSPTFHSGI